MYIVKIQIKNFRSIDHATIDATQLLVFCGYNSSGKSNVLNALRVAFQDRDMTQREIYDNLPSSMRDVSGGPKLSIWIEVVFADIPQELLEFAGQPSARSLTYKFRAIRSGVIERKIGNKRLEGLGPLLAHFSVAFVPAIRDLSSGGLEPFKKLLSNALQRARGPASIRKIADSARSELKARAHSVLSQQNEIATTALSAQGLSLSTDDVTLDDIYDKATLLVQFEGETVPLAELGTGHQSAVIINLYRQLGANSPGDTLYLFEEPDNHLHPSTIRSIAADFLRLAQDSQVMITTHSPILLAQLPFENIRSFRLNSDRRTVVRMPDLSGIDQREFAALLTQNGIRLTEPLLARRVVIVEGPFDVTVVRTMIRLKRGVSAEALDVLVIPASGKSNVVRLSLALEALGCDWRAILDWDAAFGADVAYLAGNRGPAGAALLAAIDTIEAALDCEKRRGQRFASQLDRLRNEIDSGAPTMEPLSDSVLEPLIAGSLEGQDRDRLVSGLKRRVKRDYSGVLKPRNVWLWSSTPEQIMCSKDSTLNTVERELRAIGELTGAVGGDPAARRAIFQGRLRSLANKPGALQDAVERLYWSGALDKSELKAVVDYVLDGI